MVLIFIIYCVIIGIIGRKTNSIFSLILGIFGLNYFLNGNQFFGALQTLVSLLASLVADKAAMALVIIIVLIFVLSNLLNLINIDFVVDRQLSRYSRRVQEFIVVLISGLATNLDLSNSDTAVHHRDQFELNSGIIPFINPFSIIVIFLSTLLVMFDSINGLNNDIVWFVVLINIPAIWWFIKSIINLLFKYRVDYEVNKEILNLVRPSIKIKQSRIVQTSLNGKRFMQRLLMICLMAVIPAIFVEDQFAVFFFFAIIGIISYTIYLGVKAVYEERIMAEEQIYITIRDSVLGIGPELINFLLILIFTSLSYDFLNVYYAGNYSVLQLIGLSVISLFIGMFAYRDYLFGFAMALPITLLWATSSYAIDTNNIESFYIGLISLATLVQIFQLIDYSNVSFKMILDLSYLVLVVISTLVMNYLGGIEYAFTTFVVFIIMYLIIMIFGLKKVRS